MVNTSYVQRYFTTCVKLCNGYIVPNIEPVHNIIYHSIDTAKAYGLALGLTRRETGLARASRSTIRLTGRHVGVSLYGGATRCEMGLTRVQP
jgi:hypothetical protein